LISELYPIKTGQWKSTKTSISKENNMGSYHNNQPITGSDANPDRLNREKFACNLAKILTINPSDDCLTVSLEGEWGYGKTSVVNLVKKATNIKQTKPVIIEYNNPVHRIAITLPLQGNR